MDRDFTKLKNKFGSFKRQIIALVGVLASIIAVYTFGLDWYNCYQEERFRDRFDNAINKQNWSEYDQILHDINSNNKLRNMYLFYAGYRELNKERSFSKTPNPEFFLKQIDPLSEYFPRSILFRLTWINKKFKESELINRFIALEDELSEVGYFGPYYHLNEYLILRNSNFNNIEDSYKKFLSSHDFLKSDSYTVPVKVNKNEGMIDLTVYHQIAALNYLFLTNLIRYSDQTQEVNSAYDELSRLYSTQESLETTIIGLIELNLGTPEQLKRVVRSEIYDFLGEEVDLNQFLIE